MSSDAKVEVLSKERIKPSFPTPHHLRYFKISILDQFAMSIYIPLILYYPKISDHSDFNQIDHKRSNLLKTSLSKTLTRFYPFAGRVHDDASVCCNDKGVTLLEAQVNCHMSKALERSDHDFVKEMVPNLQSFEGEEDQDLLLIQANFFECGGVAIGLQFSHKIIDAFTLSTFLNSWSLISRGLQLPPHQFIGVASRFPPLESLKNPPFYEGSLEKCTTRRFLFKSSKIESLKSKAASFTVPNPSRVEVVSALLWKSAMKASIVNSGCTRGSSSTWLQTVNMRKVLPSADNLMGNLLGFFPVVSRKGQSEGDVEDLQGLVAAMREGLNALKVKFGVNGIGVDDIIGHQKEYGEFLQNDDMECYCSSSWCWLPFYETDFGWGKPFMSSPVMVEIKNLVTLIDTSDGRGISARLTLKEEDMALFEKNEELLAYASINPRVM